jgi:hypothetical protein
MLCLAVPIELACKPHRTFLGLESAASGASPLVDCGGQGGSATPFVAPFASHATSGSGSSALAASPAKV